ncbi:MAG: PIN domain-containing protein [Chloroflexota bacterium]|nr:PIN domain-containing protein [Chloroflexota bacterium]
MYLLDTDVLSNLLKRAPSMALITKLAAVPAESQFTSSITLGELLYGARRMGPLADQLLTQIETRLLPELPVLPFDAAAARRYGAIRCELEQRGTPIGDADLRIAAIALARGLTVVTGNERHFRRVPDLSVENWLSGTPPLDAAPEGAET